MTQEPVWIGELIDAFDEASHAVRDSLKHGDEDATAKLCEEMDAAEQAIVDHVAASVATAIEQADTAEPGEEGPYHAWADPPSPHSWYVVIREPTGGIGTSQRIVCGHLFQGTFTKTQATAMANALNRDAKRQQQRQQTTTTTKEEG